MTEDYENFLYEGEDAARREEARPFSHEEMLTCEECLRANPPTRPRCLYCGAALPQVDAALVESRRPTIKQPEKWEEGYNVIHYGEPKVSDELLREAAGLLRLGRAELKRILEARVPLPLAHLRSREDARIVEERLRNLGLQVLVASDREIGVEGENRRRARALEFRDDELVAYAAGSDSVWRARWSDILLLVTGRLIVRRVETEERPKRGASEVLEAREMLAGDLLLLDIYSNSSEGVWRVVSDSFDFSCLKERKALVAAQNFSKLLEALKERAPRALLNDSYSRMRQALAPVWLPEERTESRGLRRGRPGRFNVEAVMTTDNEAQFTRYSRLLHYFSLRGV